MAEEARVFPNEKKKGYDVEENDKKDELLKTSLSKKEVNICSRFKLIPATTSMSLLEVAEFIHKSKTIKVSRVEDLAQDDIGIIHLITIDYSPTEYNIEHLLDKQDPIAIGENEGISEKYIKKYNIIQQYAPVDIWKYDQRIYEDMQVIELPVTVTDKWEKLTAVKRQNEKEPSKAFYYIIQSIAPSLYRVMRYGTDVKVHKNQIQFIFRKFRYSRSIDYNRRVLRQSYENMFREFKSSSVDNLIETVNMYIIKNKIYGQLVKYYETYIKKDPIDKYEVYNALQNEDIVNMYAETLISMFPSAIEDKANIIDFEYDKQEVNLLLINDSINNAKKFSKMLLNGYNRANYEGSKADLIILLSQMSESILTTLFNSGNNAYVPAMYRIFINI